MPPRLVARLLDDPAPEWNLTELVRRTGSSMRTISREVDRAERAGILRSRRTGPTRLVCADPRHPLHGALRQLVLGTYGPPVVVAETFDNLAGADAIVLFGSWAARYHGQPGRAPNDIDVLVIGSVDLDAIDDAAEASEARIGLPVQATARSRQSWLTADESFLREVRSRPLVPVLVGDATDVAADLEQLCRHEEHAPWPGHAGARRSST